MEELTSIESKAAVHRLDYDPEETGWWCWNQHLPRALTVRLQRGRLAYVILRRAHKFLQTRGLRNEPPLYDLEYVALVEFDHLFPGIMPYLQEMWYKPVGEGGFNKDAEACAAFLNQPVEKIHELIMHREMTYRSQPSLRVHQKPLLNRPDDILKRTQRLQLRAAAGIMNGRDSSRLGLASMLILLVGELFYQGEGHLFDSLLNMPAPQLKEAVGDFRRQYIASMPKADDDGFARRKNYNYCVYDISWLMQARDHQGVQRWTLVEITALLKDVNTDHGKLGAIMLNRARSPEDRLEAGEVVPSLAHLLHSNEARLSFTQKFDRFFPTDDGMKAGICNRCAQPIGQNDAAMPWTRRPMSNLEVTIFKAHFECLKSSWAGECTRNRSLVPRQLSNGFPRINPNEYKLGEILFALEDESEFMSDRDDEGSDSHYTAIYEDRSSQYPLRDWEHLVPDQAPNTAPA